MIRIFPDGSRISINDEGQLHRENGPAIIYPGGTKEYFLNGKRHRIDGPAIEYRGKDFEYWYEGKYLPVDSTEEFLRYIKLLVFS